MKFTDKSEKVMIILPHLKEIRYCGGIRTNITQLHAIVDYGNNGI